MQKPPVAHGPHGELVELSVMGGQEVLVAVAFAKSPLILVSSIVAMRHGAIVGSGAGAGAISKSSDTVAESAAVKPGPVGAPVSNSFTAPSDTRVKVNRGQTFSVESKVLECIVIEPVEAL